jgi:hypothetical protein
LCLSFDPSGRGRFGTKLLVGTKLDEPSDTIDRQALDRLCAKCGFACYYETSAHNGRGLAALCEALATGIDWDGLGKTSRPELFQRIRDEIEARCSRGEVVLLGWCSRGTLVRCGFGRIGRNFR